MEYLEQQNFNMAITFLVEPLQSLINIRAFKKMNKITKMNNKPLRNSNRSLYSKSFNNDLLCISFAGEVDDLPASKIRENFTSFFSKNKK